MSWMGWKAAVDDRQRIQAVFEAAVAALGEPPEWDVDREQAWRECEAKRQVAAMPPYRGNAACPKCTGSHTTTGYRERLCVAASEQYTALSRYDSAVHRLRIVHGQDLMARAWTYDHYDGNGYCGYLQRQCQGCGYHFEPEQCADWALLDGLRQGLADVASGQVSPYNPFNDAGDAT